MNNKEKIAKHFVVTGGAGFIGSHLVEVLLSKNCTVTIIDDLSTGRRANVPPSASFIEGDAADPEVLREALSGAQGCFHLAAIASVERSNRNWLGAHRVNLGATVAVLEAVRDAAGGPIPVVWASSAAVYGRQEVMPIAETANTAPLSPYGADKLAGESHARIAAELFGLRATALRLFNVYGPRQDAASPYSGVIALFAARAASGTPLEIFGDGRQLRDFVYVADVANAFIAAMEDRLANERPQFEAFNVCRGVGVSILELAETISLIVGRSPELRFRPARKGDIRESVGDPGRIRARLGVVADTPLEEGLAATIRSF